MTSSNVAFTCSDSALAARFAEAISGLARNVTRVAGFSGPVLLEGAEYPGIWLECAPHEGLVYAAIDPVVAVNNHRAFFTAQRADGYVPCYLWKDEIGSGQIQTVVPLARSALELYELTEDEAFLAEAYASCARWDDWLSHHRDRRNLGLCEAFCEYDTGHDNGPRFHGLPKQCPDNDAARCPDDPRLPFLAPDLSATLYGGRRALARMAALLNRPADGASWDARAGRTRAACYTHCFDLEQFCFFDRDARGDWVRIRGDALLRVLAEALPFEEHAQFILDRHVFSPEAFWTPFPLPSIAASDPQFERAPGKNSWGGPSQALTALRAPPWLDRYGRHVQARHLMQRWLEAIVRAPAPFRQQLDPFDGSFTDSLDGYSPALLVCVDFCARLYGLKLGSHVQCGIAPGVESSHFMLRHADTEYVWSREGDAGTLSINGRARVTLRGECRLTVDRAGTPILLQGVADKPGTVQLTEAGQAERNFILTPNQTLPLAVG